MTALEICYSARDQKDLEALLAGQRALEWLPVSEAAMDRALEVQRLLAQRLLAQHRGNGHRRPITDLIIAASAELHGAEVLHVDSDYDMIARVTGGGVDGQADAVRLGIARALMEFNAELRKKLKAEGMVTRDSRGKERKKYGQKGARKRFQYSKR